MKEVGNLLLWTFAILGFYHLAIDTFERWPNIF